MTVSMQHATFCHTNQHCESYLSVFRGKIRKNPAKNATVKIFLASVKSILEKAGVN